MFKYQRLPAKPKLTMAPLLDMIFILLIFFVVTTTFSKMPSIAIQRPEGTAAVSSAPKSLLIGLTQDGQYYIEKTPYSLPKLQAYLQIQANTDKNIAVVLVGDRNARLQSAVAVLDLCQQLGLNNFAIAEKTPQ